jgi:gliding motility-associated-like protein
LKTLSYTILAFLSFVCTVSTAQINFNNPGLEGATGAGVAPNLWTVCALTPDVQPGQWCVNTPPKEGSSYAGFSDGEYLGQLLACPLRKGKNYSFDLWLAYNPDYAATQALGICPDLGIRGNPGNLEIWGGTAQCALTELLYTTGTLDASHNENWVNHQIQFSPQNANYDYVLLRSVGTNSNILIDNISQQIVQEPDSTTADNSNIICNGDEAGTATVYPPNDGGNYTYVWSTNPVQTTQTATGLGAGTYTCVVTDNSVNCSKDFTVSVTITEPTKLNVSTLCTDVTAPKADDGTSTSTVSGGVPPYTYAWSNGETTTDIANLPGGIYTLVVTDANGCKDSATCEVIDDFCDLVIDTETTENPSCFGLSDGEVEVTASSSNGPIDYSWNTTPVQTTPKIDDLPIGSYQVTVTDANGCEVKSNDLVLTQPNELVGDTTVIDAQCVDSKDGEVLASAVGGTLPYSFSLSGEGSNTVGDFDQLDPGDYTLKIKDDNDCEVEFDILIESDSIVLFVPNDTTICFGNDVQFTASGNGVVYDWSPLITNSVDFTPSVEGEQWYVVAATSINGCVAQDSVLLTVEHQADATINAAGPFCTSSVPIQLTSLEPDGVWSGPGVDANGIFSPGVAGQGIHTITYTINGFCPDSKTIDIRVNDTFDAAIDVVSPQCYLNSSFDLTSVTPGGKWYGPGLNSADSSSALFDPQLAGVGAHKIFHFIGGSCGDLDSLSIDVISPDSAQITMPQDFCPTGLPANVVVTPSGGTWSGTGMMPSGTFDPTLTGSGSFQIKYTPSGVCFVADSLNVTVVDTLVATAQNVSVLCNGDLASVITTVTGGQLPYSFAWVHDVANTSGTASNQPAGSYDVTVTDNTGCSETVQHVISEPTKLDSTSVSQVTDVSCPSGNDGAIEVFIGGGTPGYTYSISPSGTNNGDGTFSNLTAGSYTITITDANNCQITAIAGVAQPSPILITGTPQTAYCNLPNGSVTGVTVTGGTPGASPNYTYAWDNGQTTSDLTNVVPGTYVLTVTDGNNCTEQQSFTVPNAGGASLVGTMDSVVCFGGSTGKAWVTPSGGQLPYLYTWSTGENTDTIYNKPAGIYNIEVEDGTGCKTNIDIEIKEPSKVDVAPITDQTLCYAQIYTTTLSGSNGNGAPYTYTANGVLQTADEYLDSLARTVTVVAYDQYGCASDPTQFSISYLAPLSLQMPLPDSVCPGVEVTKLPVPSGGNGNYSYAWSDGTTTLQNDYTSLLNEGSDSITLTISDGCSPDYTDTTVIYIYSVNDISVQITPSEGCEPLDVRFEILNAGFQDPIWNMGDGNIITDDMLIDYVYPIRGDYPIGLSGRTAEGCPVSANIDTINVYPIPEGEILQSPDRLTSINNLGIFTVRSANAIDSVYWDLSNLGLSIDQSVQTPYYYEFARDSASYHLSAEIVTIHGCRNWLEFNTFLYLEETVYVPSAFSPNNDGINDLFSVSMSGVRAEGFEILIFDRWGEELYSTTDLQFEWDGVYRQQDLKSGMYVWRMRYVNIHGVSKELEGRVYLIR